MIFQRCFTKAAFCLNFNEVEKSNQNTQRIKLTIEYDGTHYFGWQAQGEGKSSIQQSLEEAAEKFLKEKISIFGAGRTDAGVHALNQVAHFDTSKDVDNYNLVRAFNSHLPEDITIKAAEKVGTHFHARKSAVSKTYMYKIWNNEIPSGLNQKRALWIRKPLDLDRLNQACLDITGTHDFNCFRSEGSYTRSTERTINSAKFTKSGEFIEFRVNGNGFLKQMVRNLVGTLLQIELNERDPESLPGLIASRDRTQAGPTMAAHGLYLEQVFYSPQLDKSAQPL
jgi:tRNA pseudouridine38-40 synthase